MKVPPLSLDKQSQGVQEQGLQWEREICLICFYQFPEGWGGETLNAALERGMQGSTDELLQLHSRALEADPGVCPVSRGHPTAASATLVWFYIKIGVSEKKLLLLLSALSECVNSYWNPAEEGCQPGRSSVRFSADVNQEGSVISTELAHSSWGSSWATEVVNSADSKLWLQQP